VNCREIESLLKDTASGEAPTGSTSSPLYVSSQRRWARSGMDMPYRASPQQSAIRFAGHRSAAARWARHAKSRIALSADQPDPTIATDLLAGSRPSKMTTATRPLEVLQRADRRGYDAGISRTLRCENPYVEFAGIPPASELAEGWWRGWDRAAAPSAPAP